MAVLFKTAIPHTPASAQAAREVRRNSPIRRARTCCDHLAGVAGVTLMDWFLSAGWLEEAGIELGRAQYRLTPGGELNLTRRGVTLPAPGASHRRYCYGCVDWTERRYHMGGALPAAVLHRLVDDGILSRPPMTGDGVGVARNAARTVTLSQSLESWLA